MTVLALLSAQGRGRFPGGSGSRAEARRTNRQCVGADICCSATLLFVSWRLLLSVRWSDSVSVYNPSDRPDSSSLVPVALHDSGSLFSTDICLADFFLHPCAFCLCGCSSLFGTLFGTRILFDCSDFLYLCAFCLCEGGIWSALKLHCRHTFCFDICSFS